MSNKHQMLLNCEEEEEKQYEDTSRNEVIISSYDMIKEENDRLKIENSFLKKENEKHKNEIDNLKSEIVRLHKATEKLDIPDINIASPLKQQQSEPNSENGIIDPLLKTQHHQRSVTNVRVIVNNLMEEQLAQSMIMLSPSELQLSNKMNAICAIGYKAPQPGQQFQPIEKSLKPAIKYRGHPSSSNISTNLNIQRKQDKILSIKTQEQLTNTRMSKQYVNSTSKLPSGSQIYHVNQDELALGFHGGNSSILEQNGQVIRQVSYLSNNNNNTNPGSGHTLTQTGSENQLSNENTQQQRIQSLEVVGDVIIEETIESNKEESTVQMTSTNQVENQIPDQQIQDDILFAQLFEDVQNVGSLGDLFFEEFMIIGPNFQEFDQMINETPSNNSSSLGSTQNSSKISANHNGYQLFSGIKGANTEYIKGDIKPHILFNKPGYVNPLTCYQRQSVASFAFPRGIEYYRFRSYDDLKKLPQRFKDIILYDLCEKKEDGVNQNIFVLNLKGEEKPRVTSTLSASNPSQIMYAVCYRQSDVYLSKGENGEYTLFMFPTVYCFMTYYPFLAFFFQLILSIVNRIKTERLLQGSFSGTIDNELKKVDFASVLDQLNRDNELSLSLRTLQMQETRPDHFVQVLFTLPDVVCPQQSRQVDSFQVRQRNSATQTLGMKVPPIEELGFVEALEVAYLVFSNLPFEDFAMILTLVMLEKKVVFLSQNLTLLTFTVQTFQTLFKPLQYPHPVIFCLSDDLLHLLDAPVPILIGLNMSAKHCEETIGFKAEGFYIDLDKNTIITQNINELNRIQSQVITLRPFRYEIKELYRMISGPIVSKQFGGVLKKVFKKNVEDKQLVNKPSKIQQDTLLNLLKLIKQYVMSAIVKRIPMQPIFQEEDPELLDITQIQAAILQDNPDSLFLTNFLETQIFVYYLRLLYF